jgi:drug/metabolite transporter (DMT)-like permease
LLLSLFFHQRSLRSSRHADQILRFRLWADLASPFEQTILESACRSHAYSDMAIDSHRPAWKTLLAFAIIYFVWGSTFLAIRVGVREVPPFLLASMRFTVAGLALCVWTIARRERFPRGREWASAFALAMLIFVLDYGLLFWSEQRVPSGIAAVMLALIPVFMALSEIVLLRTQKLTVRLALALLIGIGGVAVLMSRSLNLGGAPIDRVGAMALIIASITWSIASALTRRLPLPSSKVMSSGVQMLVGGLMLGLVAGLLGEFRDFHPASVSRGVWFALAYLIIAGSIIGFTAYIWLIHHESPTKVGTYAYVNPVVAVLVGYFLGGETLGIRTIVGTLFVLVSVIVITTTKAKAQASPIPAETKHHRHHRTLCLGGACYRATRFLSFLKLARTRSEVNCRKQRANRRVRPKK